MAFARVDHTPKNKRLVWKEPMDRRWCRKLDCRRLELYRARLHGDRDLYVLNAYGVRPVSGTRRIDLRHLCIAKSVEEIRAAVRAALKDKEPVMHLAGLMRLKLLRTGRAMGKTETWQRYARAIETGLDGIQGKEGRVSAAYGGYFMGMEMVTVQDIVSYQGAQLQSISGDRTNSDC